MTDSGGPPRCTLCFLSTLLSQKVPEKSDTVLRCIISGQPKPEVTWYKNGHTVEEGDIVSSYESFENQYIHVLHLYCCTQNDAAVYQISAKNCFGMICCSASVEVECPSENTQLSSNPHDDGDTGWKCETQTYEQKSASQIDEKEPAKEGESLSLGTPMSAEPSSSEFNRLCSLQVLASNDTNTPSSENPLDVRGTRQTGEACDANNTERTVGGLLPPNSGNVPCKQGAYHHGTAQSELSELTDGAFNRGEDFTSSHQNPKAQKSISVSLPLSEAVPSIYPGDRATVSDPLSLQASSADSDSDYELCPEITLTYTEEFSDDDLEYLECSDVMTDYSNAIWQRNLEGTECVFLLESDDEDVEFGKYCLGECESFLSEMGCGPRVSDNTGRMEASPGFCGDHSQSQGVRARRRRASTHGPPSLQAGMTLTLGSHQDGTSVVTEQGTYKRPSASAENDYPGIQGETRDSHQAGEESASDSLLTTDKAVTETEVRCLSGELEKAGMDQCSEIAAERGLEEKDFRGKRSSEKPPRGKRPGNKGKPKKLNPNLKDSAAEGTPNHLSPQEPAKHPLAQSDKNDAPAEAPDLNSQLPTEGAVLTRAEQETEGLQPPPGALPQEGSWSPEGEGVQVNNLLETKRVPDQSDHPQVQTQETDRESLAPSQTPAFSEPVAEPSALTGTTSESFPNLAGIEEEHATLAQDLETEGCPHGPRHEENRDREDNTPGHSWEDPGHEPNLPEANHATMSPWELSACLPQEGSNDPVETQALSVAPPVPEDIVATQEAACHGPGGREAEGLMEAGGQGTGDPMDAPAGSPVHKHGPQEVCSRDSELAEGQGNVSDLHFPEDRTLDVVLQTRGSEPPQSTGKSSKGRNPVMFPAPSNTLTWDISPKASGGSAGEHLANMENSTSTLASTGQERLVPCISGGLEERQPLPPESSFVWCKEGDESPSTSALDATGPPANHSSVVSDPQETPTASTAHPECLGVTRESEDAPPGSTATEVHPAKHLPVSVAEPSRAGGPGESSSQVPGGNTFPPPCSVQSGHRLHGSTSEPPAERCPAPGGPEVPVCVPGLPEGGFCSNSPLQIDAQPGGGSQAVDRADRRSLEEGAQGKRDAMTQRAQQESRPPQGSLPEDTFQESGPVTSAAQGDTTPVPWDPSSAHSGEERRQSSGPVVKATEEDDSHTVGSVPPPSEILPGPCGESQPGHRGAGDEPKTTAPAASVSEVWPPRRPTGSESEGSEAGATTPDGPRAVAAVPKAGAAGPEPAPSTPAAPAGGPQAESQPASALANNRESLEGKKPARRAHWSCLSSQYLRQPRFLGSSVDPVDEGVTDQPSEASRTGGQGTVNSVSQNQEAKHVGVAHLAFFQQFLSLPHVLESSVDPIDEVVVGESAGLETPQPPASTLGVIAEETTLSDGSLGQRAEVRPAGPAAPCPQPRGGSIPSGDSSDRNQEAGGSGEAQQRGHDSAEVEVQPAALQVPRPDAGGAQVPHGCSGGQAQEAEQREEGRAGGVFPTSPLSSGLAVPTRTSVGVDTDGAAGQIHDVPENHGGEPRNLQHAFSAPRERGEAGGERGKQPPSPSGLTQLPCASSPEGNITDLSMSHKTEEPEIGVPQRGETQPASASSSPAVTSAFVSGECAAETAPETPRDPCHLGPTLGHGRTSGEERPSPVAAPTGRPPVPAWEEVKKQQDIVGSGHLTEGVKRKILSKVAALRLRLEEREKARKNSSSPKKIPKLEPSVSCTDEKKDPQKPPCKRGGRAPVLLKKIQAEMFPDHSGNVRLSCQFAEIHEDSTIWWTKDSKSIAQVQRSAGDNSTVSLAIVQAGQKDQGRYYCCLKNSYGKVTAEFDLTTEVLTQLSSHQDSKGCEEIEFSQLIFKEDFLHDSYFGGRLRGQIATEELHFGEGVHRKAFRSKVMQGLMPVFQPGHACVLKVHNAVAYGTRNNDELVQRNYDLAAQECYVQNTARCYAKIYAAEAQPLEGFGEVPEIIPIFLIRRPDNNIPYATVEEELIGEFVKYSIRDGKEINFLRRDSEAGQKCCTFQHWVYQKTGGCLLVTDMQGVGMKLTDVGIATLAKGYKGFKGNCSMTFIDQFKALHQCNKYCKMLGLKSLQNNNQKQKKPSATKSKSQPNSATAKKPVSGTPAEKKT